MKWILFIGLAGNNIMNLGDRPFIHDTEAACRSEGEQQMRKYATQAALIGSKPVFECRFQQVQPGWDK